MRRVAVGDRVKLTGSRYFPNAIKHVVGVHRDGYDQVTSVDVDCGHKDGTPYCFPVSDVELVTAVKS